MPTTSELFHTTDDNFYYEGPEGKTGWYKKGSGGYGDVGSWQALGSDPRSAEIKEYQDTHGGNLPNSGGGSPESGGGGTPTMKDVALYDPGPYKEPIVKPTEITPEKAPGYVAPTAYTPSEDATVEGRMGGILATNSPYIQSARSRAKLTAHSRGLLNTSMAAGAGEKAAIESALPIASQDAASFQEAGMTGYRGEIEGSLSEQAAGQRIEETGWQAKYSNILANDEFRRRDYDAWKEVQHQAGLLAQEGGQAAVLERIRQKGADDRLEVENQFKADLAAKEIISTDKKIATTLLGELGDNYASRILEIQSDPDLSPDSKAELLEMAKHDYHQNAKTVATMYGIELDWLDGSGTGGGDGGGNAAGDGGTTPGDGKEGIRNRSGVSQSDLDFMDNTPGAWGDYETKRSDWASRAPGNEFSVSQYVQWRKTTNYTPNPRNNEGGGYAAPSPGGSERTSSRGSGPQE